MKAKRKKEYRLTKSGYMSYLKCPPEFWLQHHQPLLFTPPTTLEYEHLRQQGYEVERYVKQLICFQPCDDSSFEFQRVLQSDEFLARCDLIVADKTTKAIDIYEIKSSSRIRDEHYEDLAFQRLVAEQCGETVRNCYLVTLNSDYVRDGEIEPEKLFVITDVTEKVATRLENTAKQVREALAYLQSEIRPTLLEYAQSGHKRKQEFDCLAINHYFPELPDHTVFHVPRIYPPKLIDLLEQGIVNMFDIPETYELSDKQKKYIAAARSGEIVIYRDEIGSRMDSWEYPLHFLDYETFPYAIPQFDGLKPYQQMCFQYSLHTIDRPGDDVRHAGVYLAPHDEPNPPRAMAQHLKEAMADGIGTVFVWFEDFEKTRNNEMSEMFPEFKGFFDEVNSKTVDMMKVFSDRLYIHPGFKGSSSIKKVLPVLCPDLDYNALGISGGLTASISWFRAVKWPSMSDTERQRIFNDLVEYCTLDTWAMVRIYQELCKLFECETQGALS